MAIAYVTHTDNGLTGSSPASVTFAHNNTATGANHILIVGIATYGSNGTADTIDTVTYNGVSMTRIIRKASGNDNIGNIYLYYLMNPASGSNNVVVTQTGTKVQFLYCSAILYSGVDNTAPINVSNSANNISAPATVSATLTAQSWLIGLTHNHESSGTYSSVGYNTTNRFPTLSGVHYAYGDSNGALESGSRSLTWYITGDGYWVMAIVALKVFIQTSTITEGVKVGDSGTSSFKIVISNLVDGIKVGDLAQTYKALVSLLTDGIKVGDLASTVINPITAWVNKVKSSTIWTNKGKRE